MRIEQLEYLATVADLGSFARAAEELHLSQPALSETIRKVETELGINIFERRRSGTTLSIDGQDVLPRVLDVIEAMDRLRQVAGDRHLARRVVRVGTVAAATAPLLAPTIRRFSELHPGTQIAVVTALKREIYSGLRDGKLDLGLVNYLDDDELPNDLVSTILLSGNPVVCMRSDDPLADYAVLTREHLLEVPIIAMRTGYLMHRYLQRLLDGAEPRQSYAADGADMGKMMVAQGLGVTVLPDYSVRGDPLEVAGAIIHREIDDDAEVRLVLHRRPDFAKEGATATLHKMFIELAESSSGALPACAG